MSYQRMLDYGPDPFLLEWKNASATGDVIEVRAFLLTTGRIELTIELPAIHALEIDPDQSLARTSAATALPESSAPSMKPCPS